MEPITSRWQLVNNRPRYCWLQSWRWWFCHTRLANIILDSAVDHVADNFAVSPPSWRYRWSDPAAWVDIHWPTNGARPVHDMLQQMSAPFEVQWRKIPSMINIHGWSLQILEDSRWTLFQARTAIANTFQNVLDPNLRIAEANRYLFASDQMT